MYMRWADLTLEQQKPLDHKIESAKAAILAGFRASKNRPALAFSAGKDSTVLADLIRRFFPDLWTQLHLIYGDTGVEYPECVKFWRFIIKEWNLGAGHTLPDRSAQASHPCGMIHRRKCGIGL